MLIYVKQRSAEPLASVYFLGIQAEQILFGLEKSGKLPGLINDPQRELRGYNHDTSATYLFSGELDFKKKSDAPFTIILSFGNPRTVRGNCKKRGARIGTTAPLKNIQFLEF